MKICNKCNKNKKNNEFNKRSLSKDGLQAYCKKCYKQYNHNRYIKAYKPEYERVHKIKVRIIPTHQKTTQRLIESPRETHRRNAELRYHATKFYEETQPTFWQSIKQLFR